MYPFEGAAPVSASLRAGLLCRSLHCLSPMCAALVFFAAICNSVDELMSAVHILALPCIAAHCSAVGCLMVAVRCSALYVPLRVLHMFQFVILSVFLPIKVNIILVLQRNK